MPDNTSTEQLLQKILEELRQLRQAFEERNRIIDAQIANQPPAPAIDSTVIEELQRRDLERRAQATVEAYLKMIAAMYDKGTAYTNLIIRGGYAAFFSLWTTSRSLIPVNQARSAAILMIISASLFVALKRGK